MANKLQYIMTSFKITSYNIQGMYSSCFGDKSINPDFLNLVNSSDIVIVLETWSREGNFHSIPHYRELCIPSIKNPKVKCGRDSGGIIVLFKENISNYIFPVKKGRSHIWIKLKKELTSSDLDIYLCAIYIPPNESPYYSDEIFQTLQSEILQFQSQGSILLMGDMNARTGREIDYIESQGYAFVSDVQINRNKQFERPRQNHDNILNKNGKQLLQLCKSLGLFITNGRMRGDSLGRFTYCSQLGCSAVDYAVTDIESNNINYFMVMPQIPLSDHSHITISLKKTNSETSIKNQSKLCPLPTQFRWEKNSEQQYQPEINSIETENLLYTFLFTTFTQDREGITLATENLTAIFTSVARKTLKIKKTKKSITKIVKNKWFDKECQTLKKQLRALSNKKHRDPTNQKTRSIYQQTLTKYKSLLRQKKTRYMKDKLQNIEDAIDQNNFWDLWNKLETSKKPKQISLCNGKIWTDHFGHLYSKDDLSPFQTQLIDQLHTLESQVKNKLNNLDNPIPLIELTKKIKCLKNKKACGPDGILNEMLKFSSPLMHQAILKLFNMIITVGFFPDKWKENYIVPVFKEGDKFDPNNYRGIAISSNLGKLFCNIINTRLTEFLLENKVINQCQIGFMQDHRTTDHIYTLQMLIDKYVHNIDKGKIFGCFIDFKKAFDTVWQDGLLLKLIQNGIGGKLYDIIKDMYNNNRCCVKINEQRTSYFQQAKGVRQGCSLSPLLFNLYINELAVNIEQSKSPGLTLEGKEIKCLLFADDLLLLSPTEEALQESLSILEKYSQTWNLKINTAKSKVMIFQRKKRSNQRKYNFTVDGETLCQVTNYNYLGLTISPSGNLDSAQKDLADKARKAYYAIRRSLYQYNPSVRLWLKIFNSIIKPILLYGSEIWGIKYQNDYTSWDKSPTEIFHLEFCKNTLGLHRNASNLACRAELGRYPMLNDICKRASKFYNHLLLNKDRCHHNGLLQRRKHPERDPFSYLITKYNLNTTNMTQAKIKLIEKETNEEYYQYWLNKIEHSNKLSCFHKIKTNYELAPYLTEIKEYKQRKLMASYRVSDHSLAIETGRHRQTWLPREERLCAQCNGGAVEDECHFLTECSKYTSLRNNFFEQFEQIIPQFQTLNNEEKMPYLLGEHKNCLPLAAKYLLECHNMRK